MNIIKYRKISYIVSFVLIISSLVSIFVWGLKPSVDFVGGSLLEVYFEKDIPNINDVNDVFLKIGFKDASIRQSGDGFIVRTKEISQEEKNKIFEEISFGGRFKPIEKNFSNIGPVLGKETLQKSWISIILVMIAIVLFIAFAFRKVSFSKQNKNLSSWIYGFVTIFALLHDVLIPVGVFAFLGEFVGTEVDTLFVTALLVILGFSVHDTIVVFDRVRENLFKNDEYKEGKDFDQIVGESVDQTLIRSLNTSLTTLLAILALYIWGPESVQNFSLALLIGIAVGTYSSIFIGSPLLVTIYNYKNNRK